MASEISIISSMATRQLLADLGRVWQQRSPVSLHIESVGGVDAARRVRAGEPFDLVVLAANAIDQLIDDGHLRAGSRVDLVHSGVAVAVRKGAPHPDIGSADALRSAILCAASIGYSTGPSGVQLGKLFERWGITGQIASRIVQAPPGVPVGSLVAEGEIELGFQQLSELMGLPGVDVIGPLPDEIQIVTTFSAGIPNATRDGDAARALLDFLSSPDNNQIKRDNGMQPA